MAKFLKCMLSPVELWKCLWSKLPPDKPHSLNTRQSRAASRRGLGQLLVCFCLGRRKVALKRRKNFPLQHFPLILLTQNGAWKIHVYECRAEGWLSSSLGIVLVLLVSKVPASVICQKMFRYFERFFCGYSVKKLTSAGIMIYQFIKLGREKHKLITIPVLVYS